MRITPSICCGLAAAAALFASAAQAGDIWDRLWRNADQRGEQLLQQGDAGKAAQTYHDLRRKAYAELQAGDYGAAAGDFARFDDGDAHYNRGNALAHAGDLHGALQAYDAALARDPKNRDAQHNRDLVEKALKQQEEKKQQQQQQQQDSSKSSQQAPSSGGSNPPPPSGGQASSDAQAQKPDDPGSPDPSASGDRRQAGKDTQAPTGNADGQRQAGASPAAQAGDKTSADKHARSPTDHSPVQTGEQPQPTPANPTDTAQATVGEPPKSEQQMAEEQWLRQIPDDPAGLLRRKFMIEHLMRQQQDPPQ